MSRTSRCADLVVVVLVLAAFVVGTNEGPRSEHPSAALPACVYEDGSNSPIPCYWDGGRNRQGKSYVVTHKP